MNLSTPFSRFLRLPLAVVALFLVTSAQGQTNTTLWGVGVKSCFSLNHVMEDWENDKDFGLETYPIYREWLMGLVSGLSASTGLDILHGTDPDAALRRINGICQDHPGIDFFNAAMMLFGRMSIPGASAGMFATASLPAPLAPSAPLSLEQLGREGSVIPLTPSLREEPPPPPAPEESRIAAEPKPEPQAKLPPPVAIAQQKPPVAAEPAEKPSAAPIATAREAQVTPAITKPAAPVVRIDERPLPSPSVPTARPSPRTAPLAETVIHKQAMPSDIATHNLPPRPAAPDPDDCDSEASIASNKGCVRR